MIQVFFFVFTLLTLSSAEEISTVKQSEEPINWVASPYTWHAATDKVGSSIDTTGGLYQDSSLQVQFKITQKTTVQWPYVELIFESPHNLSGSQGIELEYKCDRDLTVKLFQEDFGPSPKGNDTYSLYQTKVQSSENWKTVRLNFSEFSFPTWVPAKSKSIAMNLKKTKKIYLTPVLDAIIGGQSKLQVKTLRFITK